jgi:hypothetical protein
MAQIEIGKTRFHCLKQFVKDDGGCARDYAEAVEGRGNRENTMAKRSISERLAQLEVQRKTLISKQGKQERAHDTRRKVLLGAFVLHRLEKGQDEFSKKELPDWLRRELPGFLTREDDTALFTDLIGPRPGKVDGAKTKAESGKAAP